LESRVTQVNLERVAEDFVDLRHIYYNKVELPGMIAKEMLMADGRIAAAVLDGNGQKMDLASHNDVFQLQGTAGNRYQLWLHNYSNRTYEAVITVDGLDVISGQPGSVEQRGYVLRAGESLTIAGFRKSDAEVAAFRFAKVDDAYASNSRQGDTGNLGVIGMALFELDTPHTKPPRNDQRPQAFPADSRYAPPPQYND